MNLSDIKSELKSEASEKDLDRLILIVVTAFLEETAEDKTKIDNLNNLLLRLNEKMTSKKERER